MNSLSLYSSLRLNPSSIFQLPTHHRILPRRVRFNHRHRSPFPDPPLLILFPFLPHKLLHIPRTSLDETVPSNEGQIPLVDFEELFEKNWSFLDSDDLVANEDYGRKVERIVAAGNIKGSSRVMVCAPSEGFVDRLVDSTPCNLLVVVHDSLFVLAGIKERHDKVKCWQGELIYVPDKWAPLDVTFLYFLPGLPFSLGQIFEALARSCLPGSRVVISHPNGREGLEQQRKEYPDVVVANLPEKLTLEKVAKDHSFDLLEFVNDPTFYLAVLKYGNESD